MTREESAKKICAKRAGKKNTQLEVHQRFWVLHGG